MGLPALLGQSKPTGSRGVARPSARQQQRRGGSGLGELSAQGKQTGKTRPINDMWIAACCLAEGLPLATLNVKDYTDFADNAGLILV